MGCFPNDLRNPRSLTIAVLLVAVLAGCGGSSGPSSTPAKRGETVSVVAPRSGCGSFALPAAQDSSGVLKTLPASYRTAYAGLPVKASAWSGFKPSHGPPYSVGIVWPGLVNPFISDALNDLRTDLQRTGLVGSIRVTTTGNNVDIPQQLQQLQQAIVRRPDLIIVAPLQPEAFTRAIDAAGKAGIPVITFLGAVDTKYAVNLDANSYISSATVTSAIVRSLGGTAKLLTVEGYPSTTVDTEALDGVHAVLKNCPNARDTGSVVGAFVNATAKGEITKFLATHPTGVDAVIQLGGMGPGVIEAFQSTGRALPALGDIGASRGSLAYWRAHPDLTAVGTGQSASGSATAITSVVKRMLTGDEPRVDSIIPPPSLITAANLDEWAQASWSLQTPGLADGPPHSFATEAYIDRLFTRNGSATG